MKAQKIVGLLGAKGAGKDTAASYLNLKQYERVAFADALYKEVAQAFNVTVEFLGNRDTKEADCPELALINCTDLRFVGVVKEIEKALNATSNTFGLLDKWRSPRSIMQWWGTEYRRKLDDDSYWLMRVQQVIDNSPQQNFVITDVRFPNEAAFVSLLGGCLCRIRRLEIERQAALERIANGTAAHSSETAMLDWPTEFTFYNEEGQPDLLKDAVLEVF